MTFRGAMVKQWSKTLLPHNPDIWTGPSNEVSEEEKGTKQKNQLLYIRQGQATFSQRIHTSSLNYPFRLYYTREAIQVFSPDRN